MKYVIVVGDGMADHPVEELGGKTPLEVADKPNMDYIASKGKMGIFKTVPDGMHPGSDVANLSIIGYDPKKCYTGRGPLEAEAMGVRLGKDDTAFRCNFITERDGILDDYAAGHINNEEAVQLIETMKKFTTLGKFYVGIDYRHLFVMNANVSDIKSTPPHDIIGQPIAKYLIKPESNETARKLNQLMLDSKKVLSNHTVNVGRIKLGKKPANMIWLWGQGKKPRMEKFKEKYGLSGAMISAVNLIKGIGACIGMSVINVPGATGYYDTNYEGKAEYALKALETHDLAYIHVEAPDEAGHAGDVKMKIKTIEDLDKRLLGKVLDGAPEDCKIALLPDHPTPIKIRTHVSEPILFCIYAPGMKGDGLKFNESSAKKGSLGFVSGEEFLKLFLTI